MAIKLSPKQARLRQVNKAYEIAHNQLHADYARIYRAKLRQYKLSHSGPIDHASYPLEFYEELIEAQKTLIAGVALAQEAHRVSARTLAPQRGRR